MMLFLVSYQPCPFFSRILQCILYWMFFFGRFIEKIRAALKAYTKRARHVYGQCICCFLFPPTLVNDFWVKYTKRQPIYLFVHMYRHYNPSSPKGTLCICSLSGIDAMICHRWTLLYIYKLFACD
jgi:hypothetical protein